jgi:hypothetical protein
MFRRRPAVRDIGALADFIDAQAAFLVQKGIYEYSRARSGHYSKVLFSEPEFQQAVEQSRWRAYPLGLAMVAEVVEGVLRARVGEDRRGALDSLKSMVLSVFDRYPRSAALAVGEWRDARRELAHRLDLIGLHAVKFAKDVPETFVDSYFALLPIHEKLRVHEYPTIRNYLRVSLCNIHDEFLERADVNALADALRARPD